VINADTPKMEAVFSVIFNTTPDVNLVYRLDAKGTMVYHYPTGPTSTVGDDFSFRDYFQRALQSDQPLVSQGRISPTTNQAVATTVMPIWSTDGKFLGLVGANIRYLKHLFLPQSKRLSLTRSSFTLAIKKTESISLHL